MYNMVMIMCGKVKPPDLDPFWPSVWNGMADISSPWPDMVQIMDMMTVSWRSVPLERVGKGRSCGIRKDDISERYKFSALLADCSTVRRGVR